MPMTRNEFLNAVIDDGIHEIEANYLRPDQKAKRDGGIAGLEACRGKSDQDLLNLKAESALDAKKSYRTDKAFGGRDYWYNRYFELQVEWVLNVLSAALFNEGKDILIPVTSRGMLKAADILGVKSYV